MSCCIYCWIASTFLNMIYMVFPLLVLSYVICALALANKLWPWYYVVSLCCGDCTCFESAAHIKTVCIEVSFA